MSITSFSRGHKIVFIHKGDSMNTFEALKAWLEKYRAFMEKYNAGELTPLDLENAQPSGGEMVELIVKALFELDERTKK